MKILPQTKAGKWSLGLIIAAPVFIIIGWLLSNALYKAVGEGNDLIDDLTKRPFMVIIGLCWLASGMAAGITGLIALSRYKDRAILVYVTTIIGVLLILFIIVNVSTTY